jgi:hypothetical protein
VSTDRFAALDFEGFRKLAVDDSLSLHEKVGFPDSYRADKERAILRDVGRKVTRLEGPPCRVLDVGPGCGPVARGLIQLCGERGHRLDLVDSAEMLALLPDAPFVTKVAGRFPEECRDFVAGNRAAIDAILVYSVLQYVFREGSVFDFFDTCLSMLADGGQLLIGDIPNQSMRRRFFSSAAGVRHHQLFTGSEEIPEVGHQAPVPGLIDDAVVVALLLRARAAGFDAFVVPQADDLPMANRREDLLVRKP